jgi:hypothetical protein
MWAWLCVGLVLLEGVCVGGGTCPLPALPVLLLRRELLEEPVYCDF